MTDAPRRPILSLKFPPGPKAPPAPAQEESRWRCKPCGAAVVLTGGEPEDREVRCPACNAKLGLAGQFLSDPPSPKIRARRQSIQSPAPIRPRARPSGSRAARA